MTEEDVRYPLGLEFKDPLIFDIVIEQGDQRSADKLIRQVYPDWTSESIPTYKTPLITEPLNGQATLEFSQGGAKYLVPSTFKRHAVDERKQHTLTARASLQTKQKDITPRHTLYPKSYPRNAKGQYLRKSRGYTAPKPTLIPHMRPDTHPGR